MIKDFVVAYPELVITLITLLAALIVSVSGLWIRTMKKRIEEHIIEEEKMIWPKIEERFKKLEEVMNIRYIESIRMHGELKAEVTSIKSRLPNGQLKNIEDMLGQLIARK